LYIIYWIIEFLWNFFKYIRSFCKEREKKPAEIIQEINSEKELVLLTHSQEINTYDIEKNIKLAKIDKMIQHLVD